MRFHSFRAQSTLLILLSAATLILAWWSLTIGTATIPLGSVLDALLSHGDTRDDIIVWAIRLPRAAAAIVVGASLGVAGAIMQAVTNNPLASPDLLGVSAGAAFAVVVSIVFFNASSPTVFLWVAFAGGGIAGMLVYAIGSVGAGGATPVKLALSGAVLSIFLGSLSASLLIFDLKAIDTIRLWSMGSLAGREGHAVAVAAPFALVGIAGALVLARELGTASLGTNLAQAVGQNVALWRSIFGGLVIVIAGSAVALAGPIGFVGLVVPHIVRLTVSSDFRWRLPFCAVGGAFLVVVADSLQRYLTDVDVPVGVTLALVGAPFFIWLARSRSREMA
ncbi:iron chelate uptake ABC transporter family permease subunit [Agrobacterium vitis]|uniref:iron chelate uptake ABC transporter family permease subunit n=1 Tax=Rhizobium/Agrobacterium group TaxID=227290 RepID=UPI001327ED7F|nr:iron ABC transporter permease [Allorhizobium ampelinum]MVA46027.1 iron chelate uptake ABC transporter family permease subunit [Agrobacterium vitis]